MSGGLKTHFELVGQLFALLHLEDEVGVARLVGACEFEAQGFEGAVAIQLSDLSVFWVGKEVLMTLVM